jgi:hypothetical protein
VNSLRDPPPPISKITRAKWTGDGAQVVECLLFKREALSSNPSPTQNKQNQLKEKSKGIKCTCGGRKKITKIWKEAKEETTKYRKGGTSPKWESGNRSIAFNSKIFNNIQAGVSI